MGCTSDHPCGACDRCAVPWRPLTDTEQMARDARVTEYVSHYRAAAHAYEDHLRRVLLIEWDPANVDLDRVQNTARSLGYDVALNAPR